jgi:hypothetical protein
MLDKMHVHQESCQATPLLQIVNKPNENQVSSTSGSLLILSYFPGNLSFSNLFHFTSIMGYNPMIFLYDECANLWLEIERSLRVHLLLQTPFQQPHEHQSVSCPCTPCHHYCWLSHCLWKYLWTLDCVAFWPWNHLKSCMSWGDLQRKQNIHRS